MNNIDKRYFVIAYLILAILSLYYGSSTNVDNGMMGRMNLNESGWMSGSSLRWFPAFMTLFFGLFVGLLLRRNKNLKFKFFITTLQEDENERE